MTNRRLVMIPGPTPVVRSIQDQMARETAAFGDPAFVADFKDVIGDLKTMFGKCEEVFVIAGTGTLGMEAAIANTTKKGDNVLIVSNGFFGDRFIDICQRKGLNVDVMQAEWGLTITPEQIEAKLSEKHYAAVTVTHVDTATGTCAPAAEIGKVLKKFKDTMYILDGVCATGGIEENLDKMNIDVLLTGSQKAFGVAPGLTMVWASKDAMERRATLGTIPEYYCDFDKWVPIMHEPSKYFATPAVNLIWALKESVRIIKEEGIEARYARHIKNGRAMQAAFEALGFKVLADKSCRAVTLSNVIYPEGTDDAKFRATMTAEGAMVGGGLGPYAGKMFRMGHMGNIDDHDMVSAIATVERAMYRCGMKVELGKGVGTLMAELLK